MKIGKLVFVNENKELQTALLGRVVLLADMNGEGVLQHED